ncbi:MAG TPA: hypothetical protein VM658_01105 [bacterium]|nr:hypothetical protein [bacterium]
MPSKRTAQEKRQGAKNAKGDVFNKFSSRPPGSLIFLGVPVSGFAKKVGVKAVRLFPRLAAKKHLVLLGEPWRSWRLGVFHDVYFGRE